MKYPGIHYFWTISSVGRYYLHNEEKTLHTDNLEATPEIREKFFQDVCSAIFGYEKNESDRRYYEVIAQLVQRYPEYLL